MRPGAVWPEDRVPHSLAHHVASTRNLREITFCLPRRSRDPVDGTRPSATPAKRPTGRLCLPADAGGRERCGYGVGPGTYRSRTERGCGRDAPVHGNVHGERRSNGKGARRKSNVETRASHGTQGRRADTGGVRGKARGYARERAEGDSWAWGPRGLSHGRNARPHHGSFGTEGRAWARPACSEAPGLRSRPMAVHVQADPGARASAWNSSLPRGGPGPVSAAACCRRKPARGSGVSTSVPRDWTPSPRAGAATRM